MLANKRKLLVVTGIAISIALIGAIVFVSSQYFSPIVLDRNGDGRPDTTVEPYAIKGDGDGDLSASSSDSKASSGNVSSESSSGVLTEDSVAPKLTFDERKAIVESDAYKDVIGKAEWINEKCFFDKDGGFWFMPYDIPMQQYDAAEVKEIGKEVIINDAIEAYGQIEDQAQGQ
jgi:ABC-type antimicrobial peptide transport system permease subunit